MADKFKITGAAARSKTQFAVGLNVFPLDTEQPHTIFLTYDGALRQPWSRADANRNLSDITHIEDNYLGLSDEEYVYTFQGESIRADTIKGMGINAAAATEGAGNVIAQLGKTVCIAGQEAQFYQLKNKNDWMKIPTESSQVESVSHDVNFEGLHGFSSKDVFLCGQTSPVISRTDEALRKARSEAISMGDKKKQREIRRLIRANRPKPEGRAYHWDSDTWTQIDVEGYFPKTVFVDGQNRAWLGCNQGTVLLVERDEDGDFDVDDIEIIEDSRTDIYSITEFKNRLIMASAEGLFAYEEDFESLDDEIVRIKPKLNKKLHTKPSPLKVQAVDDVMYYFDYNLGIYIWDGGKIWTNIPIPPELLELDFQGLD